MEQLHIVFFGILLVFSVYVAVYVSLYLRTSRNSVPLVGTHIHPLIRKFITFSVLFAGLVAVLSVILLIRYVITLYFWE